MSAVRPAWRCGWAALALLCSGLLVTSAVGEAARDHGSTRDGTPLYLVVTRSAFAHTLKEWVAYREAQGFDVCVGVLDDLAGAGKFSSRSLTDWLSETARAAGRRPSYIMLVGDVGEGKPWHVPTVRRDLYRWRGAQFSQFPSDSVFGDLDGDDVPEVPVGRLPVRTAEELELLVRKLITYESLRPKAEDLRVVAWAGMTGFGAANDFLAPLLTTRVLGRGLPATFDSWTICAHAASPYCGYPPEQPGMFLARMRAGSAVSVMISHGWVRSAFSMTHEGVAVSLTAEHARGLAAGDPTAPLVVIACLTGKFDEPDRRCLTEEFLLQPGGPVVTIGAGTESHPLTNCYTGMAIVSHMDSRETTVGDWWLAVQRAASRTYNPLIQRLVLYAEGSLRLPIDEGKLRRDQMLMYNLLGDPACRRFVVQPFQVNAVREGAVVTLRAELPEGCDEVVVQMLRGRRGKDPLRMARAEFGSDPAEIQRRTFEMVNAQPVTLYRERSPESSWQTTITLPEEARSAERAFRIIGLGKERIWASAETLEP